MRRPPIVLRGKVFVRYLLPYRLYDAGETGEGCDEERWSGRREREVRCVDNEAE